MAQVNVTIAGRVYRMACGDGEEEHLEGLARTLDARIGVMRKQFGEIGDGRLNVMAAITLADDLADAKARIAALEAENAGRATDKAGRDTRVDALADEVAVALDGVTAAVEAVTRILSGEAEGESRRE